MKTYLNSVSTALPPYDVHQKFINYVSGGLTDSREQRLFLRMAKRAQIEHRYSFLEPTPNPNQLDVAGFYRRGHFPSIGERMRFYEKHAFRLACDALDTLFVTVAPDCITHILITSCTGFYAPGLDLQIVEHYGMNTTVERSIIGFMGCNAAINALKLARHIVRSDSAANVLIVNIELCTLHLQESTTMEQLLSFLLFSDGCSASLVSSNPTGIELQGFYCAVLPDSSDHITWHIGEQSFDMVLSGKVPSALANDLPSMMPMVLGNTPQKNIAHWAIHPGGRTVLDAVQDALSLPEVALVTSRDILRRHGNMSSVTIMFILKEMLTSGISGEGCAMAFGPGLTAETMRFSVVS